MKQFDLENHIKNQLQIPKQEHKSFAFYTTATLILISYSVNIFKQKS